MSSAVDRGLARFGTRKVARVMSNGKTGVKKQPLQDVLHGDEAEEELGLARLVSSYTLPHQNSQPGRRGRQTARSKVLSRRARDTLLRHGRDALPTWDSIAYWERGTKGSGSGF